jgi:hypothetical protein
MIVILIGFSWLSQACLGHLICRNGAFFFEISNLNQTFERSDLSLLKRKPLALPPLFRIVVG